MANAKIPVLVLTILFALVAGPTRADTYYTVEFVPSSPAAGEEIVARVSHVWGSHCWPAISSVTQVDSTIVLSLAYTDACDPDNIASFHDYPLGAYAAGAYAFDIEACVYNAPPLPSSCRVGLEVPLRIGGESAPVAASVPTTSTGALFGLLLAVLFASVRSKRI